MVSQSGRGAFSPVVGHSRALVCSLVEQGQICGVDPFCAVSIIAGNADKAIEASGCWIISFIGD